MVAYVILNEGLQTWSEMLLLIKTLKIHPKWLAQMVKNLPAMRETRVKSPCRVDPLEKEMAIHSSILA